MLALDDHGVQRRAGDRHDQRQHAREDVVFVRCVVFVREADLDRRGWAMTRTLVAGAIERIGDNAVDVGEQVASTVPGLFREFQDASHPGEPVPTQSS